MHWRDSDNNRLRRLAEEQAYLVYPELQDAEEEHDGTIEVIFSSTGAELKLRLIDSGAKSIFAYGHCAILAYAIHLKTGLPFVIFTAEGATETEWKGHVGIYLGEDQILDINGIRTEKQIRSNYKSTMSTVKVADLVEFTATCVDVDYRNDPMSYLAELEQLVTEDFAEYLIAENSLIKL